MYYKLSFKGLHSLTGVSGILAAAARVWDWKFNVVLGVLVYSTPSLLQSLVDRLALQQKQA